MNFQKRPVQRRAKKSLWNTIRRGCVRHYRVVLVLAVICVAFWGGTVAMRAGWLGEKAQQVASFTPLKIDANGHTNMLLLGVAGRTEEGGHLSDSIMIVSVNPDGPSVSMLSLPRDLFVESKIGNRKVNEVYAAAQYKHGEAKGLEITMDALSKFTGIELHYGAVVDFAIFADGIDLLGGVDVFVPEDITDPFYPDGNYGYTTFVVRKGLQHFDGKTALKYARSRKTSSDYARAQRQQDLALAIRRQVEKQGWAENVENLREFYSLFRRRINTDLGLTEMMALAKIGAKIDYGQVVSTVLNDDPTQMGGFLYTPAKEFYGGQFVLLPEDGDDPRVFMQIVLEEPAVLLENAQLSVLNGTEIPGQAGEMAARLRRFGFHVIDVDNYDSDAAVPRTFLRSLPETEATRTAKFLKQFLNATEQSVGADEIIDPSGLVDIEVVLGVQ